MHLVQKGQYQCFDDMEEDEADPRSREKEGETFRAPARDRSRSHVIRRSRSVVSRPREDGQEQKDGLSENATQDGEPTKAAASRSGMRRNREEEM